MTVAVEKHLSKKDQWVKKILKILNKMHVSKFFCIFSLRHGTIMVAITELTLTATTLFLLLLAATHAQDTVSLVETDLHNLEENEKNFDETPTFIINNEKKMLLGQHLAFIIMFVVWSGLLMTCIHFVSCILLLYGAVRRSPGFLLPWTLSSLFCLILGCFFFVLLTVFFLQECKFVMVALLGILYAMGLYVWFGVLSYYQELKSQQLKGGSAGAVKPPPGTFPKAILSANC